MGKRLKRRQGSQRSTDDDHENELIDRGKSRLSWKDAGVILIMSGVLSIGLVMSTIGFSGIMERLQRNDIMDVLLTLFFFMCLFALLSYVLVRLAAHCFVFLAVATFCGIIFPVSRRKQQETIRDIYEKADRRK